MPKRYSAICFAIMASIVFLFAAPNNSYAKNHELKRVVLPKPVYTTIPSMLNNNQIVLKFKEGINQPKIGNSGFLKSSSEWDNLNEIISYKGKFLPVKQHFLQSKDKLDEMRQFGMERSGMQLPDLSLYHRINLDATMSDDEKLKKINDLNSLDIIEIAYFPPIPELATIVSTDVSTATQATPNFEAGQYYLNAAPTGINAKYAWGVPGGRGENIKVIDIEGNWNETHEDLRGGIENFHIAGSRIADWIDHGTAVLGEIAADSNDFGMTGIAFEVDLGTVSIGSMSTASAINTAVNNSDTGDVILIELHAPGPDASGEGQDGYVCMEYWQENFDAILLASAMGRIVVEAAGNGAENFDDVSIYGPLFDPTFRFSGAIIVGASSAAHVPASFTNYGQRVDVHAFGTWDVFSLAYGDLYGSGNDNYYTATFSGTSSASPIITGACAILQGVNKANHGRVLDHNEIRALLIDYSTPQAAHFKTIGPLPDLQGSVDQLMGISFVADTTIGWAPFNVQFSGSSGLAVDTWEWDFGDGDSAFVQSPLHIYQEQGLYSVGVKIDAAGDIRQTIKSSYIVSLADTIKADSIETLAGADVEITISLNNTVPVRLIQIPIEYAGDLSLSIVSFSTEGCRTDYFEVQQYVQTDAWNKRVTISLKASHANTSPDLPAGDGPILKVKFTASASADIGETSPIVTDGYTSFLPRVESQFGNYDIRFSNGVIAIGGCCTGIRGNIDGDPLDLVDISDLVTLVDFMFGDPTGPEPPCFEEGDLDGSGAIDISDIVLLVDFMFGDPTGQKPSSCF